MTHRCVLELGTYFEFMCIYVTINRCHVLIAINNYLIVNMCHIIHFMDGVAFAIYRSASVNIIL